MKIEHKEVKDIWTCANCDEDDWRVVWRVDKERDPHIRKCNNCNREERQESGTMPYETWEIIKEGIRLLEE
jgi:hypothetical protein